VAPHLSYTVACMSWLSPTRPLWDKGATLTSRLSHVFIYPELLLAEFIYKRAGFSRRVPSGAGLPDKPS